VRQHPRHHRSRFIAGAIAIGLAGRRPELVLEIAPLRSGPPIRSGNPGGRARDPAVQHLVAFPQLLPLEFLEAAPRRHGHQLFGDQLLDPFGFRAPREMDEARRGGGARGDVFIRGRGKPERAIGLGLEGRDGDCPKPRTTADLAAAFRRIDKARAGDRRGPVEPLDTLDRCDLGKPGCPYRKLYPTGAKPRITRCFALMGDILKLIWWAVIGLFRSRASLTWEGSGQEMRFIRA